MDKSQEIRIDSQEEYDEAMGRFEEEGYKWNFGQKPTELDLYQPVDGKDYVITADAKEQIISYQNKESFVKDLEKDLRTSKEPETQPNALSNVQPKINLDDDLELLKGLLSEEEFRGYVKGNIINSIGKDDTYKQEMLKVLKEL